MSRRLIRYYSTFIIGNKIIEVNSKHRYHYEDIEHFDAKTICFNNFSQLRRAMNKGEIPIQKGLNSGVSKIHKIPFINFYYTYISNSDEAVLITTNTFKKMSTNYRVIMYVDYFQLENEDNWTLTELKENLPANEFLDYVKDHWDEVIQ